MTAQITDTYTYHGDEYSIVALTKDIEFNPEKYGFHPTAPHTACWRGYWCEFNITGGHLILDTLHVNQEDLEYPIFRGVAPRFRDSKWDHMAIYSGLNFTIDYTGSIILGKGFLDNYYIHMGYQRAWAYENVIELVLEHGSVVYNGPHVKTSNKELMVNYRS